MTPPAPALLDVEALTVSYRVEERWLPAVRDFRLRLGSGQICGLVGESGSGKSTVALALMRCLGGNGRVEPGAKLEFAGEDLLGKSPAEMRRLWARRVKLVPQNAGAALNPSIKIGRQVSEALARAENPRGRKLDEAVLRAFRDVNLSDPAGVAQRYPHELSGGMQQRVMIAMALICNPRLLILDEPTTGLDVTTEAVILDLLRGLIAGRDSGVIYITHNLGVVAQLCQRVVVLYAGEIMEKGAVRDVFTAPRHPYTQGLIQSLPQPGQRKAEARLQSIAGSPPALTRRPSACVFVERCPLAVERCRQVKPPLERIAPDRWTRCHRWRDVVPAPFRQARAEIVPLQSDSATAAAGAPLLKTRGLSKHFPLPRSLPELLRREAPTPLRAVDGVDLQLETGQTLGLVGESGSGKTTLARLIIGTQDRSGGELELLGMDVREGARGRKRELLSKLQMVFQNPQNSLNPYLSARQAIRRPLIKLRGLSADEADAEVLRLLERVNLRAEYADRFPDELSGGEKQRVAIARAFASAPDLVICDEPVSALDVSVQAAALNLLAELQERQGVAYLFVSHNLSVVGYLADVVAVMYLGQIVETGASESFFAPPCHPYTEALISAIPVADPRHRSQRVLLSDKLPSPRDLPSGCRFHTRCPRKIGEICEREEPPWQTGAGGHRVRCHIPLDELRLLQSGSMGIDAEARG